MLGLVTQCECVVTTAGQEEEQDSEELGEHLMLRIDDGREGSVGSHDTDGDSDGEGVPHPLGQEAGDPIHLPIGLLLASRAGEDGPICLGRAAGEICCCRPACC